VECSERLRLRRRLYAIGCTSPNNLLRDLPGSPVLQEVAKPFLEYWEHVRAVLARGWNVRGRKRKLLHAAIGLRGSAVRLNGVRLAGVLVVALVLAGVAAAADGGSGTYTSSADTYDFNLFNGGTTIWQYFVLIGPEGASFVGGANSAEATARCVPGQPDGLANEIECGPLSPSLSPPSAHLGFVATLRAPVACGAPFQLEVSSNGAASFTHVGDAVLVGNCGAAPPPKAVRSPVIHGRPVVGRTLVAAAPIWSATPTRVSYQWQRCTGTRCSRIKGATTRTLRLTRRDARHSVRIVATAAIDGQDVESLSKKVEVA
jgi:hypothetical protein